MTRRYACILGNLGNTKDRFCGGYKHTPDTLAMLEQAAGVPGVAGIELVGTWDVTPDSAEDMRHALDAHGLTCVSVIPDLFTDPRFGKGSFSAPDAGVRRHAVDVTKQTAEAARLLGCPMLNIWPGQDGHDYLLAADYTKQRDWMAAGVAEVAEAYPGLRLALEYKPKEPRCRSLLATMADTLLMCEEIGRDNVGVCIDTGHACNAQESLGDAVALAARLDTPAGVGAGRLFHVHCNDNHGHWDDDMIVGSIRFAAYVELLFWLDRLGYDGWISMDQYPYREDAAAAIGESVAWLRGLDRRLATEPDALAAAVGACDGVTTARTLRELLFQRTPASADARSEELGRVSSAGPRRFKKGLAL